MFCLVREAAEKIVIFLMAVPLKGGGGGGGVEHLPVRKKNNIFWEFLKFVEKFPTAIKLEGAFRLPLIK